MDSMVLKEVFIQQEYSNYDNAVSEAIFKCSTISTTVHLFSLQLISNCLLEILHGYQNVKTTVFQEATS